MFSCKYTLFGYVFMAMFSSYHQSQVRQRSTFSRRVNKIKIHDTPLRNQNLWREVEISFTLLLLFPQLVFISLFFVEIFTTFSATLKLEVMRLKTISDGKKLHLRFNEADEIKLF